MAEPDDLTRPLHEVTERLGPISLRRDGDTFVAELIRDDGTIYSPNYAHGPSEVLAMLDAEQGVTIAQM